jgi:hypothetical protein
LIKPRPVNLDFSRSRQGNFPLSLGHHHFLWARQTLDALDPGDYSVKHIEDLPRGLVGFYLNRFERLFPNPASFEASRRLLQVIVAAAEPLNREQLAAASGLDAKKELPEVLRAIGPYVCGCPATAYVTCPCISPSVGAGMTWRLPCVICRSWNRKPRPVMWPPWRRTSALQWSGCRTIILDDISCGCWDRR